MVARCPVCGKLLRTTRGMRCHVTLMHKNKNDSGVFNNPENHNGNGYEVLKEDVASLKFDVENMKWMIKPYVQFSEKKKAIEKKLELDESRGNFADCVNELKMRFGEVGSK